jgi:hypothetical protein
MDYSIEIEGRKVEITIHQRPVFDKETDKWTFPDGYGAYFKFKDQPEKGGPHHLLDGDGKRLAFSDPSEAANAASEEARKCIIANPK